MQHGKKVNPIFSKNLSGRTICGRVLHNFLILSSARISIPNSVPKCSISVENRETGGIYDQSFPKLWFIIMRKIVFPNLIIKG